MIGDIRIDGARLWQSIMEMAKIGATKNGGSHRLTLSDEDKTGRDMFANWCKDAGLTISIDDMGDMFAFRPGNDTTKAPVGMGSHLDTQPFGGKFDGVFGVLAALEVIRTLNDHDITTIAPLEVVNWTNEEGARFAPAMLASGVYGGEFALDWAQSRTAVDSGATFLEELQRIGYHGDPCRHKIIASLPSSSAISNKVPSSIAEASRSAWLTPPKDSAGTISPWKVSLRIPARHRWLGAATPCSAWRRSCRP